ncbi:MAG: ABC transporter permease, partial [Acidimicrobiales bacterium]
MRTDMPITLCTLFSAESSSSIGWYGLAASLVLVVVALGVSWRMRLGLERSMLWSCARAGVQLLVTGWALTLVLRPDASIAWSWLWVVAMVVVAGLTVRNRAPEVPGILPLAVIATAVVGAVSLGVIFGFHIFPVEARTVIPLAGMMIGNSMTSVVVAALTVRNRAGDVPAILPLALIATATVGAVSLGVIFG